MTGPLSSRGRGKKKFSNESAKGGHLKKKGVRKCKEPNRMEPDHKKSGGPPGPETEVHQSNLIRERWKKSS